MKGINKIEITVVGRPSEEAIRNFVKWLYEIRDDIEKARKSRDDIKRDEDYEG